MKIAMPLFEGKLSAHFGHCTEFALVSVDETEKRVGEVERMQAPTHAPGVLPRWLAEKGANLIIAGGMGRRAQDLFSDAGIRVIVGAPEAEPHELAEAFLAGRLQTGDNICDH
ncbi:MAG: ATPase [Candidatus Brocadiaceae bacterium]|nr:ATPase [Candidatus Brocadiaceae bacterium]